MELRNVQLDFEEVEVKCYQHSSSLGADPMNPNREQVHMSHWVSHHAEEFLKIKIIAITTTTTTTTTTSLIIMTMSKV
jgi:hypothetical protein